MKKTIFTALLTVSAFSVFAEPASSGVFTIARRGESAKCAVSVPKSPSPCLKHAAAEFSRYVRQMTGVALPVKEGAPEGSGVVRLVSGVKLGRDSFRFRMSGGDFLIEGDDDRSVLFGVYDFLENRCGCDWFTHDQEAVPRRDSVEVPAGFSQSRKPAFRIRETSHPDPYRHADFAAKMKLNGYMFARGTGWKDIHGGKPAEQFDYGWLGKCHTFLRLVPVKKYFKDHPEYFAEINGKRQNGNRAQLCLTNPDVVKVATSNILERIAKVYPRAKVFGVSQSDSWDYCRCVNCAAVDAEEGSQAGTNIRFVNQIADAVAEKYPDVIIETLAYEYTRKPPKHVRPRPNVMICICTDTCDFSKPLRETRFRFRKENDFVEDLRKWCSMSKHIHIWDYTMNFRYLMHAFPNIYSLKPNLETFLDCGVTEVFEQGSGTSVHMPGVALKTYLICKLLWDPRQPLEPLLDRFYRGYYGAAAPWMRRYMEELHAMSLARDETKHPLMMWGVISSPALKTEFFEKGAGYIAKAAEAVKDDPVRLRNVRWEMNANDYTRIMRSNAICSYVISRDGKCPVSGSADELKAAAKRLLGDFASVPGYSRITEDRVVRETSMRKLQLYADFDPAAVKIGTSVEIPASDLVGKIGSGSVRLPFSSVKAEKGARCLIEVRVKADVRPDAKANDELFRVWVKGDRNAGRIYWVKDLKRDADGYGWYAVRNPTPLDPESFFIIEKGNAAALAVDKVRVSLATP